MEHKIQFFHQVGNIDLLKNTFFISFLFNFVFLALKKDGFVVAAKYSRILLFFNDANLTSSFFFCIFIELSSLENDIYMFPGRSGLVRRCSQ